MNSEELKEALFCGCPVIHETNIGTHPQNIEYKCISAIIYRVKGGKLIISAELMDRNTNSVIICDPAKVRRVEEEKA